MAEVEEPAAQQQAARIRQCPVQVPSLGRSFVTSFVGPDQPQHPEVAPLCLLHGFDSSVLEFRRLQPLLEGVRDTYALDLLGCGFNPYDPYTEDPELVIGPEERSEHLAAFWREQCGGRPVVLVGSSLGGATAIHFALQHPGAVAGLILLDSQAFIDGIGPMASAPRPLLWAGLQVLKSSLLRGAANKMAYHNKPRFATEDARRVGSVHNFLPGWSDANIAWMRGGGYRLSTRVKELVPERTLVVWGAQDEILPLSNVDLFKRALPGVTVEIIPECGHYGHLEKPEVLSELILEFADQCCTPAAVASS